MALQSPVISASGGDGGSSIGAGKGLSKRARSPRRLRFGRKRVLRSLSESDTPHRFHGFARIVSLNGRLLPAASASVSVFDRGLLYGDGVFETIRAYEGDLFRLHQHLRRLHASARSIGLALPASPRQLRRDIVDLLMANHLKDALIRLTVTRGVGPPGLAHPRHAAPTRFIIARPFAGYPATFYRRGIAVIIASIRKAPLPTAPPHPKSLNYLISILAKQEATRKRANDALLLNTDGFLCEGTTSNLFFAVSGRLYTPSRDTGVLNGITREAVLELARRQRIPTYEGRFRPARLMSADEVFLTNTSYELIPVVRINRKQIGNGNPGPLTVALHLEFEKLRKPHPA